MKPLIITHGNCRDGFCAAWVCYRKYPTADFIHANYGEPTPNVKGRDVVMVDFSYPRPILEQMYFDANSMIVLDHHLTAREALKELPYCQFDMNRSGAGMAWDHFFPGQERPWLVNYVEDRDLWRHALPNGPAVNAYISTLKYDFETWYKASRLDINEVAKMGCVVEDKIRQYITEASKLAKVVSVEGFEGIPVINCLPPDNSELIGFLANGPLFAVGWFQRKDGKFVYSLRSKGHFDVSAFAKQFGGGGHKNSAGFVSERILF